MNPKASNLVVRTLSGVVLLVVVLGAVLLGEWTLAVLLLTIAVGSMREFYKIASLTGLQPQKGLGMGIGIALVVLSFLLAAGYGRLYLLTLFAPLGMAVFIAELYRNRENPLGNIAATLTGVLYAALPLALLFHIAIQDTGSEIIYRPWIILSYIFIVWANDIGAYLVGSAIGRHRLFERISPKKSWEGFFGGVVTAVAVGALTGWLQERSVVLWGALGAVVAVSGVWGDLVESMFKRSVGIKDSGSMMPGHGGFLDRFDALLLSAPFVFVYFIIFAP